MEVEKAEISVTAERRTCQLSCGAEGSFGNTRVSPCSTETSMTSSFSFPAFMLRFGLPPIILLTVRCEATVAS